MAKRISGADMQSVHEELSKCCAVISRIQEHLNRRRRYWWIEITPLALVLEKLSRAFLSKYDVPTAEQCPFEIVEIEPRTRGCTKKVNGQMVKAVHCDDPSINELWDLIPENWDGVAFVVLYRPPTYWFTPMRERPFINEPDKFELSRWLITSETKYQENKAYQELLSVLENWARFYKDVEFLADVHVGTKSKGTVRSRERKAPGALTAAQEKCAGAIRLWHGFESESLSVTKIEAISYTELCKMAEVGSSATASKFFNAWFGVEKDGNRTYQDICQRGDPKALALEIAKLSREGALRYVRVAVEELEKVKAKKREQRDDE